jgi:hypothetical protein
MNAANDRMTIRLSKPERGGVLASLLLLLFLFTVILSSSSISTAVAGIYTMTAPLGGYRLFRHPVIRNENADWPHLRLTLEAVDIGGVFIQNGDALEVCASQSPAET